MILVDTGAFYALADRRDRNHARSVACLRALDQPLATHPLVLAEAWYLLEARLGRGPARRLCEQVAAGKVELLPVEPDDVAAALALEARYADLALGLTDAVSLALCEREKIDTVFTFDRRDFGAVRTRHAPALRLLP